MQCAIGLFVCTLAVAHGQQLTRERRKSREREEREKESREKRSSVTLHTNGQGDMKRGRESNLGNVHKVQHDQLFYWNISLHTCSERKKRGNEKEKGRRIRTRTRCSEGGRWASE